MAVRSLVGERWKALSALDGRLRQWRDGLLASSTFQRRAAASPLTRPIARHRAAKLFDLCAGFVYSQVLAACVRLDLFSALRHGPLPAATLAARLSVPIDSLTVLLEAAASLRLLENRRNKGFGLGPLGAAMLGNPGIAAMVEHHAALYADLADPIACLFGSEGERQLARYWPYATGAEASGLTRDAVTPYTALMAASQPMVAEMVLGAYSFTRHRHLLDVGGGNGSFLIAAGQQAPDLALTLFDLPGVAAIARDRLAASPIADRVSVVEGSFLSDPLPRGADVVSLIRVVHDHDDDVVLALFERIREALGQKTGVLVIGEPMSDPAATDPVGAYFGIYLQAMGSGRPRSFGTLKDLLQRSGYRAVRLRHTRIPMIASVIEAQS